jgi:hypothetical protein
MRSLALHRGCVLGLIILVAACASPATTRHGAAAPEPAAPRFAAGGPDAEVYRASAGYLTGPPSSTPRPSSAPTAISTRSSRVV